MPPLMTIPFVLLLLQYYILFIIYICKYIINPVSQQDVKVYKKTGDRCCEYIVFLPDTIRPAKIYLLPICGTFPDIITPRRCCKNSNAEGDSYVQSKSYFTLCFSFLPSALPPTVLHLPQCGLPACWNSSAENDCDDRRADKKDRPAHRPLFPPKP